MEHDAMIDKPKRRLEELVEDHEVFDRAVAKAQAEAVRRHRLLGQPVAIWRDGQVVIEIPQDPPTENTGE